MIKYLLLLMFSGILLSCSHSPKFQLLNPKITGIDFNNNIVESDSVNIFSNLNIYHGAGAGVGDLNNDGLPDLIFAGNQVVPRVYLNLGNFKFKDITSNFEGLSNIQWYSGVTLVDINSDGWLDLYLTSTAAKKGLKHKNRLWANNGAKNGTEPMFTEMSEKYGIADTSETTAAAFFDYDRDGCIDLYLLNNTPKTNLYNLYRPKIVDGSAIDNDRLYHNNGNGTFTDVTKQAGILYEGFGLGLAISDMNKDGYPDIYVSNDYIPNDLLYINQGDGTFRNEIKKYLSYQSTSSMGNDIADVNNDGNPDILTLDMMPENYSKKKQAIDGFNYLYYLMDEKYGYEHQYLRNMLHIHNGFIGKEMLPFSEVGQLSGIYQTDWTWGPLLADYDNDGDKDLIITRGYPKDVMDKDFDEYKRRTKGYMSGFLEFLNLMPSVKIPLVAFENVASMHFVKRADWLPSIPSYSYGSSFVDLDNDGDLDFVVNNIDDKAFILRNNTVEKSKGKSNYLMIKLTGKPGNTMGLGAKVEIWNKDNYQYTEHYLTRGYASSVDPIIHFGLAGNTSVDSLKVTWPATGNVSVMKDVACNRMIEIDEAKSVPAGHVTVTAIEADLSFKQCDSLLEYTHMQTDVSDFYLNQKIIPHKFSQIGPVMDKGDLNNDGREDILIGSTNKLPTSAFIRKGKGFVNIQIEGLTTQKEFSESDLAIVDIDKDGDNDVIAMAGGYESKDESEIQQKLLRSTRGGNGILNEKDFRHYLYESKNGSFTRTELPVHGFLASVIRPCDFNHDGYPELFIGSRVKRGKFPFADDSWLISNDKGKLSVNEDSKLSLGMVTDAIWTDYDNDGWEDLLVVGEWNSITLLRNSNGKNLVRQNIPKLQDKHGFWYSIASGDFNKDGYADYIIGNLGDNHRFTVSDKYPLSIYALDLDKDSTIAPVMTGYWRDPKGKMKEYPVNYLEELRSQSSFFKTKFTDYTSFSYSAISDMFDKNILKRLELKPFVNTTSSYILWNEKGKFRWEKLPQAVQLSPVKKMIVQDLNGDGYPDVIMGGNDYTYDVSTGYYDANKGIILMNKGTKQETGRPVFDILSPSQSGLLLQGMVESLLWLKGDTSLVVAGFNRAMVSVFEHPEKIRLK